MRTDGFSGKFGTVRYSTEDGASGGSAGTELLEVTGWDFEPKSNIPKYNSNATKGFKSGIAGVRDSSGKVEIKVPWSGTIPIEDGDLVYLVLDVDGSGVNYFAVPAIIEGTPIAVNVNEGDAVGMTFNFQGDGGWDGYGIFANMGSGESV